MLVSGCDPNYFTITSDTDPSVSVDVLASVDQTTGVGPAVLGGVSGDMGQVDYQQDQEKRMFLLDSTLEGADPSGAPLYPTTRQMIMLPASDGQDRSFDIAALDPTKPWHSARLYDSGMCSSLAPLHTDINGDGTADVDTSLVLEVVNGIRDKLARDDRVEDPVVLKQWQVDPLLRMDTDPDDPVSVNNGMLRKDEDTLRISMRVDAAEINKGPGDTTIDCDNAQVDISFDLELAVTHRVAVDNSQCLGGSYMAAYCPHDNLSTFRGSKDIVDDNGAFHTLIGTLNEDGTLCNDGPPESCVQCFWVGDSPSIGSVRPRLLNLSVSVSQYDSEGTCPFKSEYADEIAKVIRNQLPDTFEKEVDLALLGADFFPKPCMNDCDCVTTTDGQLTPGSRWLCADIDERTHMGTCKYLVEADRVHIRPDRLFPLLPSGILEVVVAEDDNDVQASLLPSLSFGQHGTSSGCDPNRLDYEDPRPLLQAVTWPFQFPEIAPALATSPTTQTTTTEQGRPGRGPGIASPEGERYDHAMDDGAGRGTDEAPAGR